MSTMGKNVFGIRSVFDSQNYWINVYVGEVCNFLGSISAQQTFEAMDGLVLQLSFIGNRRKIHPRGARKRPREQRPPKEAKRGPLPNFGSSFYVFSPPPELPYVKWARQGLDRRVFVLPEVLTQTFLCSVFMGFSLLCLLAILYSFFLTNSGQLTLSL